MLKFMFLCACMWCIMCILLAAVDVHNFQCFVTFLQQPRLVEGLLRVVRICYALIAPCSVTIVFVVFLSFFFSLFPPYFITAGRLPYKPLHCSPRSQQIEYIVYNISLSGSECFWINRRKLTARESTRCGNATIWHGKISSTRPTGLYRHIAILRVPYIFRNNDKHLPDYTSSHPAISDSERC
jgi:hypothetical protein